MDAIVDFFAGIASGVTAAIEFLSGLIEDLVYMVGLLGQFIVQIPDYLSWLPSGVAAIFITIFSIVVIYKILGREG